MELAAGGFLVKLPVDLGSGAIDPAVPGAGFSAENSKVGILRFPRHCRANMPISIFA